MAGPIDDSVLDDDTFARLLDAHAPWRALPSFAGLSAWQAEDELALWQALEAATGTTLPPPFFCVAWPGAQALALALLEGIVDVRGKRVLDVGCGSGLAACAAARLGATVTAADVDPLAVRAAVLLGQRHGVAVRPLVADMLALPITDAEVILCADLIYSESQRALFAAALTRWRDEGKEVLVADSGRPFFEPRGLLPRLVLEVDVPHGVEGRARRTATVYTFPP